VPARAHQWYHNDRMVEAGSTYVALGSSFAAGPGIEPIVDAGAARSGRNYAHQVAEALSLRLVDVTSSGATTQDILSARQRTRRGRVPPQIDAAMADAKLVTITVGGNDLGYIGSLIRGSLVSVVLAGVRIVPARLADRWRDRVDYGGSAQRCAEVADSLVAVVNAVRAEAPAARVVLVDYLTVLDADAHAGPDMPLRPADVQRVRATAMGLAAAFTSAAAVSGADLVLASAASSGHGVGSAQPWVTGFRLRRVVPYHPTPAGMSAVADLVVALLRDQRTT
jgi:lysophospholipase L1-like esterase